MNVNCNVGQCQFNKNNTCLSDSIEINFLCDEYKYAICSNYIESVESIRMRYHIVPCTIDNFKYIVFSRGIDSPTDYLEQIMKDLKLIYKEKGIVKIIFDNLLSVGNSSNRYLAVNIDLKKEDMMENMLGNSWSIYKAPKNSEIRKISANYYKNQEELIEYSILNSVQKKMILKGLAI